MLVNIDRIPASIEADATIIQFTSPITADVPIVATAVCATVFKALTPAAFNHFVNFFLNYSPFVSKDI